VYLFTLDLWAFWLLTYLFSLVAFGKNYTLRFTVVGHSPTFCGP